MSPRLLAAALALLAAVAGVQGAAPPPAAASPGTASLADASLAAAQAEAVALRATLGELRAQSSASIVRLEQAEDELAAAVSASLTLGREVDQARAVARGTDDRLRRRIAALYRSGGTVGLWVTVLDARTPTELVRAKANLDAVVAADARLHDSAELGSGRLAALEQAAGENAQTRTRAAQEARREAEVLETSMDRQAAALAGATERVRALVEQQRLAAAAEAVQRLAREQAAVAQAAARALAAAGQSPSTGALGGPLFGPVGTAYAGPPGVCPVGAVPSFTDTWHAPRSGGRLHQGTDVFAPEGSPAYAVVDAVVERWSGGGLGGIALWLRGDDGTRYYYAHNAANLAPVGSRVRAGQLVAYVGRTGNAAMTPAHVHFEAHPGGGPAANPAPWLAAICAG